MTRRALLLAVLIVLVVPAVVPAQVLGIGVNTITLYGPAAIGGPAFSITAAAAPAATRTLTVRDVGVNADLVQSQGALTNGIQPYTSTLTPVATPAAVGTTQQTFTVTGLSTSDRIYVNGPAPTSLCPMVGFRVSAANTLQLDFTTLTAVACTPAAGSYTVFAIR